MYIISHNINYTQIAAAGHWGGFGLLFCSLYQFLARFAHARLGYIFTLGSCYEFARYY